MVECESIYGGVKLIPKERLFFRPSVYGIIVHEGKIALVTNQSSGKYFLPGGGVEIDETLQDALRREVKEETGLEIDIEQFAFFREGFFYYDPEDTAFHALAFYFVCGPKTLEMVSDNQVNDLEAEKPRWVPLGSVSAKDFQACGDEVLQAARTVSSGVNQV